MGRGGYNGGGGGGGWALYPKGSDQKNDEEALKSASPHGSTGIANDNPASENVMTTADSNNNGDVIIQISDTDSGSPAHRTDEVPSSVGEGYLSPRWRKTGGQLKKPDSERVQGGRGEEKRQRSKPDSCQEKEPILESGLFKDLDEDAQAYMSLILEYRNRQSQGRDVEYKLFADAMAHQGKDKETACRFSMVKFMENTSVLEEFSDHQALKQYISSAGDHLPKGTRRLFILEDLSAGVVCQLGSFLRIHPSVFAFHFGLEDCSAHNRSIAAFPSIEGVNTINGLDYASSIGRDPSADTEKRYFALRYPILMPRLSASHNPDPKLCPPWLKADERLGDQSAYANFNIERSLHTPSLNGIWDVRGRVASMAGQVTYWSRIRDDGGWDALLLVDPCIKDPQFLAMLSGTPSPNLHRILQYADIDEKLDLPEDSSDWKASAKFSKFILYNDLMTHLSLGGCQPGATPIAITPFIRGFAINKWVVFLNHLEDCIGAIRGELLRDGFKKTHNGWQYSARWGGHWSEWVVEQVQARKIDLTFSLTDLESNMHALGLDPGDITSFGVVGKREAQMWRYIWSMIRRHRDTFQDISNSYTQVIALRETQTSNLQARSVGKLTVLGTLFVPASLIASMFSMAGKFLPGDEQFWVYWAVTVPLVVTLAVCLFSGLIPWISSTMKAKHRQRKRR